jgi:hypothetical protein
LDENALKVINLNINYDDFTLPEIEKKQNINYNIIRNVYALKIIDNNNLAVLKIVLKNKKIINSQILKILPKN